MDPALQAYVEQCRASGMTDVDIVAALRGAGWTDAQLHGLLSTTPVRQPEVPVAQTAPPVTQVDSSVSQPAKPKVSKGKKLFVGILLLILALLLPTLGIVALAEFGYLPAVSRLYRKSSLPLLWNGTNGNAPLSMARVLAATSTEREALDSTLELQVKLETTDATKQVTKLPWLNNTLRFASFDNTEEADFCMGSDGSGDNQFCDTAIPEDDSAMLGSLLPANLVLKLNAKEDGKGGYDLAMQLDTKTLIESNPYYGELLKDRVEDSLTMDVRMLADIRKLFFRSNLIPYVPGDEDKWYQEDMEADLADQLESPERLGDKLTQSERDELAKLAKTYIRDLGIERKSGVPLAHYQMVLDAAAMRELETSDLVSEYLPVDADDLKIPLQVDLWVTPRTAQLSYFTASVAADENGMLSTISLEYEVKRGAVPTIQAPKPTEIMQDQFDLGSLMIN